MWVSSSSFLPSFLSFFPASALLGGVEDRRTWGVGGLVGGGGGEGLFVVCVLGCEEKRSEVEWSEIC